MSSAPCRQNRERSDRIVHAVSNKTTSQMQRLIGDSADMALLRSHRVRKRRMGQAWTEVVQVGGVGQIGICRGRAGASEGGWTTGWAAWRGQRAQRFRRQHSGMTHGKSPRTGLADAMNGMGEGWARVGREKGDIVGDSPPCGRR